MTKTACTRPHDRHRLFHLTALLVGVAAACCAGVAARAGSLDDIHARGMLIVGTKADYQPFGFRSADSGTIVGFEPDLAGEIAKALGVSLKLVPVVASTRVSMLASGDLDRYGPDLHLYKDTNQVYAAVKAGECFAAYDDAALIGQLQLADWQDYEMPLRTILAQPWGMAVRQGNTELAAMVGDLIKKWHASGHIQALEKTWRIPPSIFAEEMHRRYADAD